MMERLFLWTLDLTYYCCCLSLDVIVCVCGGCGLPCSFVLFSLLPLFLNFILFFFQITINLLETILRMAIVSLLLPLALQQPLLFVCHRQLLFLPSYSFLPRPLFHFFLYGSDLFLHDLCNLYVGFSRYRTIPMQIVLLKDLLNTAIQTNTLTK